METILGLETAFPFQIDEGRLFYSEGMSKRFYAACAVVNGMLANDTETFVSGNIKANIETVYEIVDELLKQENE